MRPKWLPRNACTEAVCWVGKRRGAADVRWLWPDALRVLAEVRPAWAIFENPTGLRSLFEYRVQLPMEEKTVAAYTDGVLGDHRITCAIGQKGEALRRMGKSALDKIVAQIKLLGYAVQPVRIPACAVNAPHRRERYWIVANASQRGQRADGAASGSARYANQCGEGDVADAASHAAKHSASEQKRRASTESSGIGKGDMGNAECEREQRRGERKAENRAHDGMPRSTEGFWDNFVWLSCGDGKFRRAPDESVHVAHGLHRSILSALGNSIVWPVAAKIIAAMIETSSGDYPCTNRDPKPVRNYSGC